MSYHWHYAAGTYSLTKKRLRHDSERPKAHSFGSRNLFADEEAIETIRWWKSLSTCSAGRNLFADEEAIETRNDELETIAVLPPEPIR